MSVLQVAHRAGNDPDLMRPALDLGAALLEADVHLRRGRLEVRHARSMGPLRVLWEPWYLVPYSRLLLSEVVAALPPGGELMLDLKGWQPWLGRRVRDAMADAGPYVVCTRHWRMLDAFEGLEQVRVVHSARTRRELRRLPARLSRHPGWGVSVHRGLLTSARVAALRRQAEVVMTWPIDTPQVHDEVVALGVNAVISNDLAVLAAR